MSNSHTPLHAIGPSPTGTHYVLEGRRAFASTDTPEDAALIVRAVNSHAVLVEALRKLAAFDDIGANRRLADTGSYLSFDEPGAVETARAALAQLDKP
jgi:hypothetical protein